jgi:hypothetical protein
MGGALGAIHAAGERGVVWGEEVGLETIAGKIGNLELGAPEGLGQVLLEGEASSGEGFVEDLVVFEEGLLEEGELGLAKGPLKI